MRKRWLSAGIVAVLATTSPLASAMDITRFVRNDGAGLDTNDGTTWATAYATIQKAVDQLNATSNNLTVNIQASPAGQAYYVVSKSFASSSILSFQGGWSDVGGTPVQDSYSVISDTNGPIDQPGVVFSGAAASCPHTAAVGRVNFTNVTYAVCLIAGLTSANQYLLMSNCVVAAQSHGLYLEATGGAAGSEPRSSLFVTNSVIRGGLSGSGDGVYFNGPSASVDVAPDVTVSSAGGANFTLRDVLTGPVQYTNSFQGTFGPAAKGYDLVKYGNSATMNLLGSNALIRPTGVYGSVIGARAQGAGRPLGTNTTELLAPSVIRLSATAGVPDTPFGPIAFRNGQALVSVVGVANGGTWTADALTRANRAVLLVLGTISGSSPYYYALAADDKFRVTGASAPVMNNGMVDPYLLGGAGEFLKHDATLGFAAAASTLTNNINTNTASTKVVLCNAVQTLTNNNEVYALFVSTTAANNISNGVGGPYTLTIGSGGLSASSTAPKTTTLSPNLQFGTAGEKESLVFVGLHTAGADTTGPGTLVLQGSLMTTNGLTKSGFGTLRLSGDSQATLRGPITVNGGALQLNHPNALPSNQSVKVVSAYSYYKISVSGHNPFIGSFLDLNGNGLSASQLLLSCLASVGNTAIGTTSTLTLNGNVESDGGGCSTASSIAPSVGAAMVLDLNGANRAFNVADGTADPDLTVGAQVIGTAGLTKTGAGRMDLVAANNTFSGGITILDGILTGYTPNGPGSVQTPFGDVDNTIAMTNAGAMRYGSSTAAVGNGATTRVGRVTFAGGNKMWISNPYPASVGTLYSTNTMTSLTRADGTRGVLLFQGTYTGNRSAYPGSYTTLLAVEAPTPVNGMVPAYFVIRTGDGTPVVEFVNYDATLGFKLATYDVNDSFTVTASQKVNIKTATAGVNVPADRSMWALKTAYNITNGSPRTISIGSGGLLFNGTATIQPTVQFGTTNMDTTLTPAEALVYVEGGANASLSPGICGTLASPIVTTSGLTKFGDGILALNGDSAATFSGPVWVQAGVVSMGHAKALGSTAGSDPIYLQADARLDIGVNLTLARPIVGIGSRQCSITTGSNLLTIAAGGSLTPGAGVVGAMQLEDVDFRGTYNWDYSEAGADLIKAVNLTFGGTPAININWLGAGPVPALGTYELFRYYGDAPVLGSWTVHAPSGCTGTLSIDTTGRRVLVTMNKVAPGTALFFR
jgi:autotransporter-associated beta strand protein